MMKKISYNLEMIDLFQKSVTLSKSNSIHKIIQPKLVISKLLEKMFLFNNKTLTIYAVTFWNERMRVVIPEIVSISIYRYGYFEEGLTRMVLEYLKPGMTFIDIGSHFGYFTLLSSYIVGETGKVHAFDPTKSTFEMLKLNTEGKKNVILNNLAVSSKKGRVSINDYGIRYSAWNSLHNARLPERVMRKLKPLRYDVNTLSVDEYINENNVKPDFIKIDAESHEYEILSGMNQTIDKYHPIITVEVGDFDIEGVPSSRKIIEFLIDKGYQPYEYIEGNIIIHEPREKYSYDNIIFLPKNR